MAGSEPKVSPTPNQFWAGAAACGNWIAPIIAFILVAGILLALVGAMLAPADRNENAAGWFGRLKWRIGSGQHFWLVYRNAPL